MLSIETENDKTGSVSLAGSLTRQEVKEAQPVDKNNTHISNIGQLVENMVLQIFHLNLSFVLRVLMRTVCFY